MQLTGGSPEALNQEKTPPSQQNRLSMIVIFVRRLTAPWRFSFNLQLQRQTEERPDENDQSQHQYVLYCRRDNDRADDVASNEELEAEQNCATNILPVKRIVIASIAQTTKDKPNGRQERATNNDKYTYAINASADDFHKVTKIIHSHVSWRKALVILAVKHDAGDGVMFSVA